MILLPCIKDGRGPLQYVEEQMGSVDVCLAADRSITFWRGSHGSCGRTAMHPRRGMYRLIPAAGCSAPSTSCSSLLHIKSVHAQFRFHNLEHRTTMKTTRILPTACTLLACLMLTLTRAQEASSDILTNSKIVEMVRLGLGEAIIFASIESSPNDFDMSTNMLIALKKDGVTDAIITAMMKAGKDDSRKVVDMNDPLSPHRPGIYYRDDAGQLVELLSTVTSQNKSKGGFGTAISYGIAKTKTVTRITGPHARQRFDAAPKFYFYFNSQTVAFDQNASNAYGFLSATNPNEFVLARLQPDKDVRELEIGSVNYYTQETGIDEKHTVPFELKQVAPGIFEVTTGPLTLGEYCFMFAGSAPSAWGQQRVYDFGL